MLMTCRSMGTVVANNDPVDFDAVDLCRMYDVGEAHGLIPLVP